MTALRVAVLGGGRSSEHEVSLASAASIREGLRRGGHEAVQIEIGRDGVWKLDGVPTSLAPGQGVAGADVVFPALHGPLGEDGTVQGLLESLGVAYVGAGVLASALCMDKVMFKRVMAQAGLPQVEFRALRVEEFESDRPGASAAVAELGYPVFVKPARLGSSVGIARVAGPHELDRALAQAFTHDPLVIVEANAAGMEVECAVIGNLSLEASPAGEIVLAGASAGGWYDYEAKYTPGGMELIVPARLPDAINHQVRALALEAYRQVGCSGLARVDFFVIGEQVLVNELNTMPGFTPTSVFPKLFAAGGIGYPELLDRLVALGLERHRAERDRRF